MKRNNLMAMLVASIALLASCSRNTYKATDATVVTTVPADTRTTFLAQYPNATNVVWMNYDANNSLYMPIDWELTGWAPMDANDYVVSFDMNGDKYYGYYDTNGDWIGTAYVVSNYNNYSSLPGTVISALNREFPGYGITSVTKEYHKDKMLYEVELKNSTNKTKLLIDYNGNIVKQKTKQL